MKIIESLQKVTAGWYLARIVAVVRKKTCKGELEFLRCRIISNKNSVAGQEIDFLLPDRVKRGSHFHRFLVSVLGSLDVGEDVNPGKLVNRTAAIRVKRVRKGKRSYSNVVAISPPKEKEVTVVRE
jgi:hypothetical protein